MANSAFEFGSLYAVYELLERWGVRWLFPGELGTVIPNKSDLVIESIDFTDSPAFSMRNSWLWGYDPEGALFNYRNAERGAYKDEPGKYEIAMQCRMWCLRNRAGNSNDRYVSRHHSPTWWSRWSETHPEYLGLYRGQRGFRKNPPGTTLDIFNRSKINCSSDGAACELAQWFIEYFKESSALSYTICEQDGSGGFCESDASKALDAEAKVIYDPRGNGVYAAYGRTSYSDRYVHFWNNVAERVAKECPDRYLGAYLYGLYRDVPSREKKLHPNISPVYCNNGHIHADYYKKVLNGWSAMTPNPLALYYPPTFDAWGLYQKEGAGYGAYLHNFPFVMLKNIRKGLIFCRDLGILGFRGNSVFSYNNIPSHGLMMYAMSRWYWNPETSAEEILDDYTKAAFGDAAGTMKNYFNAIEKRKMKYPEPMPGQCLAGIDTPFLDHHLAVFTPEFIKRLKKYLQKASEQAKIVNQKKRIEILRANLDYADIQIRTIRVWKGYETTGEGLEKLLALAQECKKAPATILGWQKPPKDAIFLEQNVQIASALNEDYQILAVLDSADWLMKPDPYQEGVEQKWYAPGNVDNQWRSTNMNMGYDLQGLHGTDCLVWYRKSFKIDKELKGKSIKVAFRVFRTSADIYVNGKKVGQQILNEGAKGKLPFVYDITDAVEYGADNEIVTRVWGYTDRGVSFQRTWVLAEK